MIYLQNLHSDFIKDKRPETMIESVMKLWIGSSFSAPKKYLAKNGVEFAKEQYCNMSQNLNTDLHHTIAEGP